MAIIGIALIALIVIVVCYLIAAGMTKAMKICMNGIINKLKP